MSSSSPDLAIYTPTLDGGVGRVVFNLAQELIEKNYAVEIIVNQITPESFIGSKVPVVDLHQPRTLKNFFALIGYFKRKQPRVFMSAIYHGNIVSLAAHAISCSRSRMIISEHIALTQALANEKILLRVLLRILIPMFYRFADAIVTVSKSAAEELKANGVPGRKIKVIYNPVITKDMQTRANENIDHPWFEHKNAPVIVGIGRLTQQKDFATLIKAFAEVRKNRSAKLAILGDGPEQADLNQLIRDLALENDTVLLGFIKNPLPYIKKADVFVLSSRWEGLPTVLIEAMALGTAVISTDCPTGPREILNNGQHGILVRPGDEHEMAKAIENVLNSPRTRNVELADLNQYRVEEATNNYEKVIFP